MLKAEITNKDSNYYKKFYAYSEYVNFIKAISKVEIPTTVVSYHLSNSIVTNLHQKLYNDLVRYKVSQPEIGTLIVGKVRICLKVS